MKVTVKYYLNVRVGKPSVNAPTYQYLAPGSVLEVDGILYNGDLFEGTDKWLKDGAENYYWAGGINSVDPIITPGLVNLNHHYNYNKGVLNIPNEWRDKAGEGICIAILDTGFFLDHPDLKNRINTFYDATGGVNRDDPDGHGTHVAGLIGASSETGITGIAPKCKIIAVKIKDDQGYVRPEYLLNALDFVQKEKPSVINISLGLTYAIFQNVKGKLLEIIGTGTQVVASAGENKFLFSDNSLCMPAYMEEVISVGAIDKSVFSYTDKIQFSSRVDFIMPLQKIISCSNKANSLYALEAGSSMACALVSGIIALKMAATPVTNDGIVEEIKKIANNFSSSIDLESTLFLINPKS